MCKKKAYDKKTLKMKWSILYYEGLNSIYVNLTKKNKQKKKK